MMRRASFRGVLLLTLVAVALGSMTLLAIPIFSIHRRTVEDLSTSLAQQTLQRVADRLDELVRTATNHQLLYARMAPKGKLKSSEFPRIMQQLWSAVQPHPELSYLGVGIAETGEYAMLRQPPGESLTLRMYVRDPETGPEIRDYRPTAHGLQLLERSPWTNTGEPRTTYDLRLRPFYILAAKARRSVWTDSYPFWGGTERGEIPGVSYATPIYDESGQLSLVWDVDLELQSLSLFLKRVQRETPGELLIVEHRSNASWRLIAQAHHSSDTDAATVEARLAASAFVRNLPPSFADAEQLVQRTPTLTVNGRQWQAACAVLEGPDRPEWLIAELWPVDAAPQPASLSDGRFLAIFAAAGACASICAWWVSRFIAAPLQSLEQEARALAAGERPQLAVVDRDDEVGRLSQTLNHLADAVREREHSLEHANAELRMSQERLRAHIDRTPVGALELDLHGRIVDWNPSAEHIFGWSFDEVRNRRFEFIVPPEIRPDIDQLVEHLFARTGGFRNDNQNITKDGRRIECEWYNTPLVDADGHTRGIACLVLDVTERKRSESESRQLNERLEARVRERTAELQLAISDLESFSYSVAHDLRAPLRSINGFSQAIAEECGNALTESCAQHLQRIQLSTRRMGSLIDALLRLARVARSDVRHEIVDLTELARLTFLQLRSAQPERNADIRLTSGLIVVGDRQLLSSLIENICDNAWKFTRERVPAVIEFISEERPDGRWFGIRDNGVGFDADFAHKAIEPFQRLHRVEDFEGHGIGLATAARIARKHGGDVCLVARPEGGAICWFRLEPALSATIAAADEDSAGAT